jgi:hypothetical protein
LQPQKPTIMWFMYEKIGFSESNRDEVIVKRIIGSKMKYSYDE